MAAFAQLRASRAATPNSTPSRHRPTRRDDPVSDTSHRLPGTYHESGQAESSSGTRDFPQGPCNFKDIGVAPKPPTCGCRRFWADEDGTRQMWCVCGHHACYHDRAEKVNGKDESLQKSKPLPPRDGRPRLTAYADPSMAPPLASTSARLQQSQWQASAGMARSQLAMTKGWLAAAGNPSAGAYGFPIDSGIGPSRTAGTDAASQGQILTPSDISSSGLPKLPSCLLLDTQDLMDGNGKRLESGQPSGLGLYFKQEDPAHAASPTPTVYDPIGIADLPPLGSQVPSTRQASTDDGRNASPDPVFMQRLMGNRLAPALEIPNSQAPRINFEDFVQSATEVATPSIAAATPDLSGLDQLVQETKGIAEILARATAVSEALPLATERQMTYTRPSTPNWGADRSRLTPSSASQPSAIQHALRHVPATLDRLASNLNSIHERLTAFPHSLQRLSDRMEVLETVSFSHVPPEEFHERFEMVDTRLVDAEQRLDEHGRRIVVVEVAHTEGQYRYDSRLAPAASPGNSFDSHHTGCSASSSALIAAAMDRAQTETKLKDIEERLGDLETVAPPSFSRPWEIEIVLLPWGRDLKGVWFASDDSSRPESKQSSQDEEEEGWTQARALRSQSRTSTSFHSSAQTGWSSQAIQDWANDADDWHWPKACGINGLVYRRLKSRGLVRTAVIKGPGSKETQNAIRRAFGDLMPKISGNIRKDGDSQLFEDDAHNRTYYGLNAPFVPLRKIHKSSRLRFLTPSEMVTPAIWTAEFLASGVMMRATGGQRRLYVTNREAYLQRTATDTPAWTWQTLRELPRTHFEGDHLPDNSSKGEQEAQVSEGDANEPCWSFHPALDIPPASIHSSFASLHSHVSIRPMPAASAFRAPSPTEVQRSNDEHSEFDARPVQPITPISEIPTQVPYSRHRRQRTVSVPLTDSSASAAAAAIDHDRAAKRRVRSFEVPTNPLIEKLPSFMSPASREKARQGKRRRITRSRERSPSGSGWPLDQQDSADGRYSRQSDELSAQMNRAHTAWTAFTPRSHQRSQSKDFEQTSPFFDPSRYGDLDKQKRRDSAEFYAEINARIVKDMRKNSIENASSISAGSRKRGTTPFAYATPYSGPVIKPDLGHDTGMDEDEVWEGVEEVAIDSSDANGENSDDMDVEQTNESELDLHR